MSTNVIELNHVQKNFGRTQALKNVTFNVPTGEVVGFLGPNGAGKSTTIRILLGMLKRNGGEATVFGQDPWHNDLQIHPRIAYVPGDVYLWPNLTGGEIVDLLLRLNGQNHTAKTDELMKVFEFDPKKKARAYSKGNRQKVALIAALSQDAELYIFDEPTSGLDPLNELTFQQEVLKLKEAGKTVLLSSHILSEVEKMCDAIVIIREGEIIEQGNLDQMRHLSRLRVQVETDAAITGLDKQSGVYDLKFTNHDQTAATFAVDHDVLGQVMAALTPLGIKDFQSTPPTLEDLFLHYYSDKGATQHVAQ
ncbi:ABC transporter ATP-binding protein [Schleiferilactobacillus shenzhenensis]|uniref:Putative ABC transporter ATP-binding protein n=1 Tax=Schleiferilactobacillus shenzhenensis LY-73 TaxID=1231336 RepID=U4TQJ4_9LACO|nr:ABC transporter ATP-binding protein [Schleiferilactobacillus shenzhenensis]ERL63787.1 putative ABC transporter ATP-binding protein [Schleiferilactobacillus shenzhenensis LY-73]